MLENLDRKLHPLNYSHTYLPLSQYAIQTHSCNTNKLYRYENDLRIGYLMYWLKYHAEKNSRIGFGCCLIQNCIIWIGVIQNPVIIPWDTPTTIIKVPWTMCKPQIQSQTSIPYPRPHPLQSLSLICFSWVISLIWRNGLNCCAGAQKGKIGGLVFRLPQTSLEEMHLSFLQEQAYCHCTCFCGLVCTSGNHVTDWTSDQARLPMCLKQGEPLQDLGLSGQPSHSHT